MSDWSADAEQIRRAQDDPRWHETGSGPFVLVTRALIWRDGGGAEYVHRHRFSTLQARDSYAEIAKQHGLQVEVV